MFDHLQIVWLTYQTIHNQHQLIIKAGTTCGTNHYNNKKLSIICNKWKWAYRNSRNCLPNIYEETFTHLGELQLIQVRRYIGLPFKCQKAISFLQDSFFSSCSQDTLQAIARLVWSKEKCKSWMWQNSQVLLIVHFLRWQQWQVWNTRMTCIVTLLGTEDLLKRPGIRWCWL